MIKYETVPGGRWSAAVYIRRKNCRAMAKHCIDRIFYLLVACAILWPWNQRSLFAGPAPPHNVISAYTAHRTAYTVMYNTNNTFHSPICDLIGIIFGCNVQRAIKETNINTYYCYYYYYYYLCFIYYRSLIVVCRIEFSSNSIKSRAKQTELFVYICMNNQLNIYGVDAITDSAHITCNMCVSAYCFQLFVCLSADKNGEQCLGIRQSTCTNIREF